MTNNLISLVRRNGIPHLNHTMSTLVVVLLVLLIVIVALVGALLFFRQRRKTRKSDELPMYSEKRISTSSTHSHHRRVNVRPSQSIHIYHERQILENASEPSSPSSSLPEIRITFPEEVDASGKRQSGRVVVVHVGDSGVGLEPVTEKLPPYQRTEGERFHSVDLERVGGLVETEKESRPLGWR